MVKNDIYILGIETSCDETSCAVIKNGRQVLSNIVASQMEIHKKYGGVVPEIASREHMKNIFITCQEALSSAKIPLKKISAIAVVNGPGLKGSLLVGLSFAKAVAFALNKPLIGVNHIEAHIYANLLNEKQIALPFISLIVSGGHTSLILVRDIGEISIIGKTRDDAAGEAFDKIAKYLDLGYPGGPIIEKLALSGDRNAIRFPRPLTNSGNNDFSFSGLKTAVIYHVLEEKKQMNELKLPDLCASFQQAVIDILLEKSLNALHEYHIDTIVLGGGVTANESLRKAFTQTMKKNKIEIHFPPKELCTDNAAMVGCTGYYKYIKGNTDTFDIDVYTG